MIGRIGHEWMRLGDDCVRTGDLEQGPYTYYDYCTKHNLYTFESNPLPSPRNIVNTFGYF